MRPVHRYDSSPPSHSTPTNLAPHITVTLKPPCPISVDNFPAFVDLHYIKISKPHLLFLFYLRNYFLFVV